MPNFDDAGQFNGDQSLLRPMDSLLGSSHYQKECTDSGHGNTQQADGGSAEDSYYEELDTAPNASVFHIPLLSGENQPLYERYASRRANTYVFEVGMNLNNQPEYASIHPLIVRSYCWATCSPAGGLCPVGVFPLWAARGNQPEGRRVDPSPELLGGSSGELVRGLSSPRTVA